MLHTFRITITKKEHKGDKNLSGGKRMTFYHIYDFFFSFTFTYFSFGKEIVKEALMEEQKRSEKAIEEAVKRTREELMEYIKEQKRVSYQWIMGFIMK